MQTCWKYAYVQCGLLVTTTIILLWVLTADRARASNIVDSTVDKNSTSRARARNGSECGRFWVHEHLSLLLVPDLSPLIGLVSSSQPVQITVPVQGQLLFGAPSCISSDLTLLATVHGPENRAWLSVPQLNCSWHVPVCVQAPGDYVLSISVLYFRGVKTLIYTLLI
jgi:hypothetical protein